MKIARQGCGYFAGMLALFAVLSLAPPVVWSQAQPAPPAAASVSSDATNSDGTKKDTQTEPEHKSFGGELAEQTREATGAEKEDNESLKHSSVVQLFARVTGMSVHHAHLTALWLNFAVVAVIIVWAARKFLPGMFRNRTEAIQQALQEARAASEDANRRLADIETRLRQLDVEIGQMQSAAEKEAGAEDDRIEKAAEEDIKKIVRSAEQEIASAAKQARRELSNHTADLAIALARSQIHVDPNTDQVLVRTFASHLVSPDSSQNNNSHDDRGGKDGR
jgi:F-type H+-transporting ATPase subunit b